MQNYFCGLGYPQTFFVPRFSDLEEDYARQKKNIEYKGRACWVRGWKTSKLPTKENQRLL